MRLSSLALAVALVAEAIAIPTVSNHVLHERRDMPMRNWVKRSRVHGASSLPVRIGLTQRNLNRAEDLLMEV